MRYPEFLKDNGRIGFIAPSFGCATEPYISLYSETLKRFSELGYSCIEGPNCRIEKGLGKSNTACACGAEINEFFTGDRCDVIISCGGGETMCEDLDFVDFEAIASSKPRWFMGYSDNTNLTFTLPTLCDTAAIYGPHAGDFGQKPLPEATRDAFNVLTGKNLTLHNYPLWEKEKDRSCDNPFAPFNVTEPFSMRIFNPLGQNFGSNKNPSEKICEGVQKPSEKNCEGVQNPSEANSAEFSGRLIGGCLDVLLALCGTRFDRAGEFAERYKKDGILWFLEPCELGPMDVRRGLWQLRNAGWFENASGFIFGRPMLYDRRDFGMSYDDAVLASIGQLNLPIIFDADLGHLPPAMPIISGAFGSVKAATGSLTIQQQLI